MATVRSIDLLLLDDLFEMNQGYVLNFSDKTMSQFFASELNIDIDEDRYREFGQSKAKRLRCFLQSVDSATAIRVLNALWEYREALRLRAGQDEKIGNAHGRFLELVNRLGGMATEHKPVSVPTPVFDREKAAKLLGELINLSKLEPHPRGYAFEAFLRDLFHSYGMKPRDGFRVRGEQIDGSFLLGNETYLLEAKWHGPLIGAAELHTFHGKLDQKAAWTRGVFISYSGFSSDGIYAFGRGKRVICMDGLDISDALTREIPINSLVEAKVRAAAETGETFVQSRNLFP